ncbi:hypothetical protein AVEN_20551-1 [Araneus ventricosus]|uniref:Uncharacterized protein n=1 Tax=Araneus ventricosus TaxID=182803 RepID=A0A4Y2JN40_ARAVE|nr:hypothetical protein AVEN_20551-1 [Araneus ventricosus]
MDDITVRGLVTSSALVANHYAQNCILLNSLLNSKSPKHVSNNLRAQLQSKYKLQSQRYLGIIPRSGSCLDEFRIRFQACVYPHRRNSIMLHLRVYSSLVNVAWARLVDGDLNS